MNKKIISKLLFILMFFLPGCYNTKKDTQELLSGLVIINVLDKACYDDCHIEVPKVKNLFSINVTLDSVTWCKENIAPDSELVLYCSDYRCTTSEYMARKLVSYGFKNVFVYEGGMAEWYQHSQLEPEKFKTYGPCKKTYLSRKIEKVNLSESKNDLRKLSLDELADKIHTYSANVK